MHTPRYNAGMGVMQSKYYDHYHLHAAPGPVLMAYGGCTVT